MEIHSEPVILYVISKTLKFIKHIMKFKSLAQVESRISIEFSANSRAGCLFCAFTSFRINHGHCGIKQLQSHGSHPFPEKAILPWQGKVLMLEVWEKTDHELEIFPQNLQGSCLSVHEQRIPFDVVIIWNVAMAQH